MTQSTAAAYVLASPVSVGKWHTADVPLALTNVRFEWNNGHDADVTQCPPVTAKSKLDLSLRQFPKPYWRYLLATALFGIGNSSNSFLILQTKDLGASLEATILIYAAFNLWPH
jgi:hypothetical protein